MICELHGPRRPRITRNSLQTPATASWDPKLPICSEYQFVAASRKTKITILRIIFQKHSKLQPWGAQGKGTLPHVRHMNPLQCRPWTGTYSPLGYHRTLVRFNLRRSSYVHIHMVDTHILYIHTYIHIYIYTYIYIYIYSYVFTCRTRYMLCMSMLPLLP